MYFYELGCLEENGLSVGPRMETSISPFPLIQPNFLKIAKNYR
jgi:hypothetical protein